MRGDKSFNPGQEMGGATFGGFIPFLGSLVAELSEVVLGAEIVARGDVAVFRPKHALMVGVEADLGLAGSPVGSEFYVVVVERRRFPFGGNENRVGCGM